MSDLKLHERPVSPGKQADMYEVERIMRVAAEKMRVGVFRTADKAVADSIGVERLTTDIERAGLERKEGIASLAEATIADLERVANLAHAEYERCVALTEADRENRDAARCGTCYQVVCPDCGNVVPEPR